VLWETPASVHRESQDVRGGWGTKVQEKVKDRYAQERCKAIAVSALCQPIQEERGRRELREEKGRGRES
jgi:hypothetical protein